MKKMTMKHNEPGRTMVEMLGVLAIMGVLSLTAVAGITYAMRRQAVVQTVDLINTSTTGILTGKVLNTLGNDPSAPSVVSTQPIPLNAYMSNVTLTSAAEKDVHGKETFVGPRGSVFSARPSALQGYGFVLAVNNMQSAVCENVLAHDLDYDTVVRVDDEGQPVGDFVDAIDLDDAQKRKTFCQLKGDKALNVGFVFNKISPDDDGSNQPECNACTKPVLGQCLPIETYCGQNADRKDLDTNICACKCLDANADISNDCACPNGEEWDGISKKCIPSSGKGVVVATDITTTTYVPKTTDRSSTVVSTSPVTSTLYTMTGVNTTTTGVMTTETTIPATTTTGSMTTTTTGAMVTTTTATPTTYVSESTDWSSTVVSTSPVTSTLYTTTGVNTTTTGVMTTTTATATPTTYVPETTDLSSTVVSTIPVSSTLYTTTGMNTITVETETPTVYEPETTDRSSTVVSTSSVTSTSYTTTGMNTTTDAMMTTTTETVTPTMYEPETTDRSSTEVSMSSVSSTLYTTTGVDTTITETATSTTYEPETTVLLSTEVSTSPVTSTLYTTTGVNTTTTGAMTTTTATPTTYVPETTDLSSTEVSTSPVSSTLYTTTGVDTTITDTATPTTYVSETIANKPEKKVYKATLDDIEDLEHKKEFLSYLMCLTYDNHRYAKDQDDLVQLLVQNIDQQKLRKKGILFSLTMDKDTEKFMKVDWNDALVKACQKNVASWEDMAKRKGISVEEHMAEELAKNMHLPNAINGDITSLLSRDCEKAASQKHYEIYRKPKEHP